MGVIRESSSNYAAPILLVKKKDSGYRLCLDYRKLNDATKTNKWPMPRIQDIFDTLYNAKVFSKMDISNGYFNFSMHDKHVHKTAFSTQDGLYEFLKVPQGLKNSPSFFNHALRKIFVNLLFYACFLYLDDILVYARNFNEHLRHLEFVFQKLRMFGLKVKPSKCEFGFEELKILGHIISKDGIKV